MVIKDCVVIDASLINETINQYTTFRDQYLKLGMIKEREQVELCIKQLEFISLNSKPLEPTLSTFYTYGQFARMEFVDKGVIVEHSFEKYIQETKI